MDLAKFPDRLRALRERRGMTQWDVAKQLGINQSTYAVWELGKKLPTLERLADLCKVLNVRVEHLLTPEDWAVGPPMGVAIIPILGRIRAGVPLISEQNVMGEVAAPGRLAGRADYALVVSGDSMSGVGILDGDIVYMASADRRQPGHGDIVAALVGESDATLKWLVKENGSWWLKAANPKYDPIPVDSNVSIQGVYMGMLLERKPVELDPPSEEMPLDLLIQRLAERLSVDPALLDRVVRALAGK